MSETSIDETVTDLVNELLSPQKKSGLPNEGLTELENTAWFDFTEVKYLFDPVEKQQPNLSLSVAPSVHELDTLIYLQENGADDRDYAYFIQELRNSIARGVVDNISSMGLHTASLNYYTPIYDSENRILYFEKYDENGDVIDTQSVNIQNIIDVLMTVPPFEILADIADIYFSIQFADEATTFFAKETFFTRIYQFFASKNGEYIHSYYMMRIYCLIESGNLSLEFEGLTTQEHVETMWYQLNEKLTELYGEGIEDIAKILADYEYIPPPPSEFSFNPFLYGQINLGLRLVYRQVWRPLGNQRGEIVRTIPLGPKQSQNVSTKIVRRTRVVRTSEQLKATERSQETSDTTKDSREIVREATSSFNWEVDQEVEGGFNAGIWKIGGSTSANFGGDSSQSSRNTSSRLSDTMRKMASKISTQTKTSVSTESETTFETTTASEISNPNDEIPITYIYSKLQRQYEVFTSLAELQNVVMIAEKIPTPEEINLEWVKKYDWIIAKVLLDDSFRDALNSVSQEIKSPDTADYVSQLKSVMDTTVNNVGNLSSTSGISINNIDLINESQKGYRKSIEERIEWQRQNYELKAKQNRLYEHIRSNILHYCRAIWLQEDPQQRILRYRKLGLNFPLNWDFIPNNGNPIDVDDLLETLETDDFSEIDGQYVPKTDSQTIDIAELINPAGPISFYANYAVYYMRPEFMKGNIFNMLQIYKTPYLYYDSDSAYAELMDPVFKGYKSMYPADNVTDDDIKNNQSEMIDIVPDLRRLYKAALKEAEKLQNDTDDTDDSDNTVDPVKDFLDDLNTFKKYFAEFLYRKDLTRHVLVDTNNLMIDIIPGDGSTLEKFKLAHRGIDVLKALTEKERIELENLRRDKLIELNKLGDPEIEKVTIVSDPDTISDLINYDTIINSDTTDSTDSD